jgi:hypothetical protein
VEARGDEGRSSWPGAWFYQFIAIQIDEGDLAVHELIVETGLVKKKFCVSMVAGPFGHCHGSSP